MRFTIRNFEPARDYRELSSWWTAQGKQAPLLTMLPEETTFVVEHEGIPLASASLYVMNCEYACTVEQLIGNPAAETELRRKAVDALFAHLDKVAGKLGYRALVLFSTEPRLNERYQDLGFTKTLENVTTFAKAIKQEKH